MILDKLYKNMLRNNINCDIRISDNQAHIKIVITKDERKDNNIYFLKEYIPSFLEEHKNVSIYGVMYINSESVMLIIITLQLK